MTTTEEAAIVVLELADSVIAPAALQAAIASQWDNGVMIETEATAVVHQETTTTGRQSEPTREAMMMIHAKEGTRSVGPQLVFLWVGLQPSSSVSRSAFPFLLLRRVRLRPSIYCLLVSRKLHTRGKPVGHTCTCSIILQQQQHQQRQQQRCHSIGHLNFHQNIMFFNLQLGRLDQSQRGTAALP